MEKTGSNVSGFVRFDIISNDNLDNVLASTVIPIKFDNYSNYLNTVNLKKYYNYLSQTPDFYPQNGLKFPDVSDRVQESLMHTRITQVPEYAKLLPLDQIDTDTNVSKKFNEATIYVYGFIIIIGRTPTDISNTYRYRKMMISINIKNYKMFLNMDNIMNSDFKINPPTKNFFFVYDYFKPDGSMSEITPSYKIIIFMIFGVICCLLLLSIAIYFIFYS